MLSYYRDGVPDDTPQFIADHFEKFKREFWTTRIAHNDATSQFHRDAAKRRNSVIEQRARKLRSRIAGKETHQGRVENDSVDKGIELVNSTDEEHVRPRSKHDPHNYKIVVKEIIERDQER